VDVPSDDPDTPIANDPTRDIVGAFPLLYAEKRAALLVDLGSPGSSIRATRSATRSRSRTRPRPGDGRRPHRSVPANTTYVANTTTLNGVPYGQPDGGAAPLAAGIVIGTIAPGATAVVQYELQSISEHRRAR
jgi:hypothetical protein